MSEELWNLKRENLQLKLALMRMNDERDQARAALRQQSGVALQAELKAMGEKWVAPGASEPSA